MTNTNKILLGVGAIALAYYLYTKRGKGGTTPQAGTTPSPSQKTYYSREECEKIYDKALASGNAMSAIPRESHIQNCMKQEKKVTSPSPSQKPCGENEVPCGNGSGKCYSILAKYKSDPCKIENQTPNTISDDYKFQVLENFSVEYFSSTTGKFTNAYFTKGQIIHAKIIPMGNVGGLATTPDGKYPNMGIGSAIVNVPESKLKRLY